MIPIAGLLTMVAFWLYIMGFHLAAIIIGAIATFTWLWSIYETFGGNQ